MAPTPSTAAPGRELCDGLERRPIRDENLPRRGVSMFASPLGGIAFGAVFIAVGGFIILVGSRVIPVDPASVHAPYWTLTAVGACFAAGGLFVAGSAVRQGWRTARWRRLRRQRPFEPWFADYPWEEWGYRPRVWGRVFGAALAVPVFATFAAPFNWVGFFANGGGHWAFALAAGLFDLLVLWTLIYAIRVALHSVRYGRSAIHWSELPIEPGKRMQIEWRPPRALPTGTAYQARLRLIEEYFVVRGHGRNRSRHLQFDCLYEQALDTRPISHAGLRQPLTIELPAGLPQSALGADLNGAARPRYYLLTIDAQRPGIDFHEHYLVPVYST